MAELRLAFFLTLAFLAVAGLTGRLAFVGSEISGRARRVGASILLVGILVTAVFYPLAGAFESEPLDPSNVPFPWLFAGHAMLAAFLTLWWVLSGRPAWRRFLSWPHDGTGSALQLGVYVGILGWVLTILTVSAFAAVLHLLWKAVPTDDAAAPSVMYWMAGLSFPKRVFIVLAAMTVEEAFFRAFLQARFGILVSSILFAAAHFSYGLPLLVAAVFTISLVIGALFEHTHHLGACVAAHGAFDAIQLLVVIPLAVRLVGHA